MQFLYFLDGIRNPVFDIIMSFFTLFGEETIFIVLAMILFWCVDKYEGYYMLTIGFLGTQLNNFLKVNFRIDSDLYRKLLVISKNEYRSVNGQIFYLIKQYIDDYEREYGELML